jgi:hypothetical protein
MPIPNRFNMNFHNGNTMNASALHIQSNANIAPAPKPMFANIGLNSPMIGRIHKAKPGCGGCGKKVA